MPDAAIDRGLAAEQRWRDTGKVETIPAVDFYDDPRLIDPAV